MFVLREPLEYVSSVLSGKPVALSGSTIYSDNSILAAVVRNLSHSNRFAVLLNNVVTGIACDTIEIHRIVEVIADYGIPPKTDHKVFEALVTIRAVAGLRMYGVNWCRCNVTCLIVGEQRCSLTTRSLESKQQRNR